MLHKKQPYEHISRTIQWNKDRDNMNLDWNLEIDMLQEELDELRLATTPVDIFDALLDLKFVLTGSLAKMKLSATQIVDGYEAVLTANESKSSLKNSAGKITKPKDFVGPESTLQRILDQ